MNPSFSLDKGAWNLSFRKARANLFSAILHGDRTHDMEWILENI